MPSRDPLDPLLLGLKVGAEVVGLPLTLPILAPVLLVSYVYNLINPKKPDIVVVDHEITEEQIRELMWGFTD